MDQLLPESPADVPQARPIQHSYSSPETFLFLFKDLIATSRSVSEAPAQFPSLHRAGLKSQS